MKWNSDLWRDVAESVFSRIYPGDEQLFDQVWEYLEANPAEPTSLKTSALPGLGIGGDSSNIDPRKIDEIVTLFIAFLNAIPVDSTQVLERVVAAYRNRGEIDERLELITGAVKEQIDVLEQNPEEQCLIKRLCNGRVDGPKLRSTKFGKSVIHRKKLNHYDFIIDELSDKIAFRGEDFGDIGSLSRVQRSMLLLAFSRIGESEKEIVTTDDLFALAGMQANTDFSNYRNQFGKRLKGIHRIVFKHFETGSYKISREGWSFWWIYKDEEKSLLLPR